MWRQKQCQGRGRYICEWGIPRAKSWVVTPRACKTWNHSRLLPYMTECPSRDRSRHKAIKRAGMKFARVLVCFLGGLGEEAQSNEQCSSFETSRAMESLRFRAKNTRKRPRRRSASLMKYVAMPKERTTSRSFTLLYYL